MTNSTTRLPAILALVDEGRVSQYARSGRWYAEYAGHFYSSTEAAEAFRLGLIAAGPKQTANWCRAVLTDQGRAALVNGGS